ncbi:MAG: alpha/beta hydrolase [Bacteroidales bacterium]|nr:alpha/beta hydrolase [Bacteroidales bacterium]MBR2227113.1 alpha/beta hydrolase [Bacteroidales bacterium]MBR4688605.1 alpha/beta hydrolase [Bacteroidales bacterium]
MKTILYIHGMGGGGDSRIPRLLREQFEGTDLRCIVRTYDFDPETGHAQIASWVEELHPDLVIGESLGAIQALRVRGIPHLFVSPSLGAPDLLVKLAWICKIPGGKAVLHRIWRVKEGDRQPLRFEYDIMKKYGPHWEDARKAASEGGYYFAFFGTRDHYRKSGVVNVDTWSKMFGNTFQMYEGTHFMEEEYVYSLLIPKIREVLAVSGPLCK